MAYSLSTFVLFGIQRAFAYDHFNLQGSAKNMHTHRLPKCLRMDGNLAKNVQNAEQQRLLSAAIMMNGLIFEKHTLGRINGICVSFFISSGCILFNFVKNRANLNVGKRFEKCQNQTESGNCQEDGIDNSHWS